MANKNDDVLIKIAKASGTVLAGSLVAAKTMGFAYICKTITRKSNAIIGFIGLVGLEIIYNKAGRTFADAVHKKRISNDFKK